MQYKYVDLGMHFQGLPAHDLDDQDLSDDQKYLLEQAVKLGMYTPVTPAADKKIKKLATSDDLLKGSPDDKSLPQDPTAAG